MRADNETNAMGTIERFQNRMFNLANRFCCRTQTDDNVQVDGIQISESDLDENKGKQYRLAAARRVSV